MKRKKVDASLEKSFLIAMITNKVFLATVATAIDTTLFPARYCGLVAEWCVEHFKTYTDCPGRDIVPMYHAWVANEQPEESDADAVHDFLESLSELYDTHIVNVPFLIDKFNVYMTLKSAERLSAKLKLHIDRGEHAEVTDAIQTFRAIRVGDSVGFKMKGVGTINEAYAEKKETIIEFGGEAARFFNPALMRDSLVGIQGPEKRGKTWWCLEFLFRALRSRKKVAMFEVGDLSKSQLVHRVAMRMAKNPMWRDQLKDLQVADSLDIEEDADDHNFAKVTYSPHNYSEEMNEHIAYRAQKKFWKNMSMTGDELMFSVHPMYTINVRGIDAILRQWQHELDFVPDVILIDYADILAPENMRTEGRDMVNETWMAARRLSQEWHACVIMPTQANAASYTAETQTMANFSNDKRKNAHVTAMLGLNQSDDEKLQQVMRLNWILLRENTFSPNQHLWITQCIPLGVALMHSVFK